MQSLLPPATESESKEPPSTQLPVPVGPVQSLPSTPESSELSTIQSTGTPVPLRYSNKPEYESNDGPLIIPLPRCRLCQRPVESIRVEPDVGKGMLKVTASCHARQETVWVELQDLLNSIALEPGEAF